MATRHELGRSDGRNSAYYCAHAYAEERGEHITSLARDACGFNARAVRHVNNIRESHQTSLDALEQQIGMRTSARRPSSEEAKSRGEQSRTIE